MSSVRDTLATTTNPLVAVGLTWALVWAYAASVMPMTLDRPGAPSEQAAGAARGLGVEQVWDESWSERYPGCVALALWPGDERPVALVTRTAHGDVTRVSAGASVSPGQVLGACR